MTKPKFTPGPWKHSSDEGDYFEVTARATETEIVSGCGCCSSPWVNSEADAHLIAAAPELYGVLEYVRDVLGPHDGWADDSKRMIDAALAKARGESHD